jgi:hypothetical protein
MNLAFQWLGLEAPVPGSDMAWLILGESQVIALFFLQDTIQGGSCL